MCLSITQRFSGYNVAQKLKLDSSKANNNLNHKMSTVPYGTVCVMPGAVLGIEQVPVFEAFFLESEGVRVRYLEEVVTGPSRNRNGQPIPETGGRNDIIFAVHDDDVAKFALRRFAHGVRWLDDVLDKDAHIYPAHLVRSR